MNKVAKMEADADGERKEESYTNLHLTARIWFQQST